MAILLGNLVWEGISTEEKPTEVQGAKNGQYFKEIDYGDVYTMIAGEWVYINLGLSLIKATKSGRITTDGNGVYEIVFNLPFPDDIYNVNLTCEDKGSINPALVYFSNITLNGFTIQTRESKKGDPLGNINVSRLTTRDYNPNI